MIYTSLIFLILAAICNAVMDVTQFHYEKSIFKKINRWWWDGTISWRNKYIDLNPLNGRIKIKNTNINYPVQLTDAFHFFKMLMVVFNCLSIITFVNCSYTFLSFIILLLIYGTVWNMTFSLFYNKILKN